MAWKGLYRLVKQVYLSQQGEIESENHRFYTWLNSIRIGFPNIFFTFAPTKSFKNE